LGKTSAKTVQCPICGGRSTLIAWGIKISGDNIKKIKSFSVEIKNDLLPGFYMPLLNKKRGG